MKKFIGSAIALACVLPVLAGALSSGLEAGEKVSAFRPTHVAGPDKGTKTCPPCKYGNRPAVQVWVNGDDPKNVAAIMASLAKSGDTHKKAELKTFVLFITDKDASKVTEKELTEMGMCLCTCCCDCSNVGVAFVSPTDPAIEKYKINTDSSVKNTVITYRDKTVVSKQINVKGKEGVKSLQASIDAMVKVDSATTTGN